LGKRNDQVVLIIGGTTGLNRNSFSLEIRNVTVGADLDHIKSFLRAYTSFLAASTASGEIDLDRRLEELADLPGANVPPLGALLLALVDGEPAGCVAFGPITLSSGEIVAELRRMWVSPAFRGHAIGRSLILEAASRARSAGHNAIYLDCLFAVMPAAIKLYRAMGFETTERYKNDHSVRETAFLRLDISQHSAA
jgi:GNAT superfamily N-acetyltransferase